MARAIWMTLSVCVGLVLSGCGAAAEAELDASESDLGSDVGDPAGVEAPDLGSLEQPLTHGTVGRAGYTCAGLKCTCTGDIDCGDMFGDGVCGDVSSCDTSDPLNPKCECLILRVQKPPRVLVANPPVLLLAR